MEIDFYGEKLKLYRANLHTHSRTSDGQFSPAELIARYAAQGYDCLALSDHNATNRITGLDATGMVMLFGVELDMPGPRGIQWHLLALGVPENFPCTYSNGETAVTAVRAAGGIVFAAHPYWCGLISTEVMSLKGIAGIEVFNASARSIGREYSIQLWDETLDAGCQYQAIAVDDTHQANDLFHGRTMIAAPSGANAETLLEALRAGRFYAMQGPEFSRLSWEDGVFEAEFSPVRAAYIIGRRNRGNCFGVMNPAEEKNTLTSVRLELSQMPRGYYLRCQLVDEYGRMAWSNPIFGK